MNRLAMVDELTQIELMLRDCSEVAKPFFGLSVLDAQVIQHRDPAVVEQYVVIGAEDVAAVVRSAMCCRKMSEEPVTPARHRCDGKVAEAHEIA